MINNQLLELELTIPEEIRHSVFIRRTPALCYAALTTPEGWNGWFTTSMFIDLKLGGVMIFEWDDWGADHISTGDHGVIIKLVPDRSFSFTWHPDSREYTTKVDITLEVATDGCVVRVVEQGFRDSPEGMHAMLQSAVGWGEALTLFKMYMEHGIRY